jgi:molybdopterin synthase catalytic subunit
MVEITEREIKLGEILNSSIDKTCGAVVSFTGVVRRENKGKEVKEIFYESYDKMALKVLKDIEKEAIEKFGVENVQIIHRKGILKPGEVSLLIAVSSKHRQEAFLACWFIIEEIKKSLPVWKKEVFEDGEEWVEG